MTSDDGWPFGPRLWDDPVSRASRVSSPRYRKLVAAKYDGSQRRGPGRPRTRATLAELVARMASENPTWGYTRIRGAQGVGGTV